MGRKSLVSLGHYELHVRGRMIESCIYIWIPSVILQHNILRSGLLKVSIIAIKPRYGKLFTYYENISFAITMRINGEYYTKLYLLCNKYLFCNNYNWKHQSISCDKILQPCNNIKYLLSFLRVLNVEFSTSLSSRSYVLFHVSQIFDVVVNIFLF